MSDIDEHRKNQRQLRDWYMDALEESGYGVMEQLELWNGFIAEVKQLPNGIYTYTIGKTEIAFTIQK